MIKTATRLGHGGLRPRTGIGRGEGELDLLAQTFDEMTAEQRGVIHVIKIAIGDGLSAVR